MPFATCGEWRMVWTALHHMKFVTSDFIYDNLIAKAIFLNDFIYKLFPINVDAFYLFSHMLT